MPQNKRPSSTKNFGDKEEAVAGFLDLLAELIAREWHRRTANNTGKEPVKKCKKVAKPAKKSDRPPGIPN